MKKIGSAILSCVLCFSVLSYLKAQSFTTVIAPTASIQPSTIYKADIKVINFKKIVGAQFTINWDSTVLRFRGVSGFALTANPQVESFGVNKTAGGMLAFQWYDDALKGRSLDDSTTLFSINFDVIGMPNSRTPLSFTDDIALREIADSTFTAVTAKYHDGSIQVLQTTGTHTYNSAPQLVEVADSYPNPFHDYTQVQVNLKTATRVHLVIQNIQGQTVYEEQRILASGTNTVKLTKEMFPASGTYQYVLLAPDFIITQKLIFL